MSNTMSGAENITTESIIAHTHVCTYIHPGDFDSAGLISPNGGSTFQSSTSRQIRSLELLLPLLLLLLVDLCQVRKKQQHHQSRDKAKGEIPVLTVEMARLSRDWMKCTLVPYWYTGKFNTLCK